MSNTERKDSKRLSILMLANESPVNPIGGLGVHVHNLAKVLADRVDITVLAFDHGGAEGLYQVTGDATERCREENWTPRLGSYRLCLAWSQVARFTHLGVYGSMSALDDAACTHARFLRRETFDVIHLHDYYLEAVARYCQVVHRAPIVVTAHLSFYGVAEPKPEQPHYRWCVETERNAYQRASRVIAVSESYRQLIADDMLIDTPIDVIHNGVDVAALEAVGTPPPPHWRPGRSDQPVVGFVGRPVDNKGVRQFAEAARMCPEFHFLVFARHPTLSDDPYPAELALIEADRDLPNFTWVRDCPMGEHWARAKAEVDVAIVPSTHEPFGIVALEWMALGKPLIVSNVGGLAEFCTSENSVVIEPTTEAIVEALRSRAWENRAMVEQAKYTARQFTWEKAAEKTLEVYRAA